MGDMKMFGFAKKIFKLIGDLAIITFGCLFLTIFIIYPLTNYISSYSSNSDTELPAITAVLIIMVWILALATVFTAVYEAGCGIGSLFSNKIKVRIEQKRIKRRVLPGLELPLLFIFTFLIFCGTLAYLVYGVGMFFAFGFVETIFIIINIIKHINLHNSYATNQVRESMNNFRKDNA